MKYCTLVMIAALLAVCVSGCSKHSPPPPPKGPDLGVVEVSDGVPTRHDLGGGRVCTVVPAFQKDGSVLLTLKIEQDGKLLVSPTIQTLPDQPAMYAVGDIAVSLTPHLKR